jgi:hypothetical protein
MGRVAIEYLTDLSKTAFIGKVLHQWLDKIGSLAFTFSTEAIDFQIRLHERSNQVRPNRTLMIGLVPLLLWAAVAAFVAAVARR